MLWMKLREETWILEKTHCTSRVSFSFEVWLRDNQTYPTYIDVFCSGVLVKPKTVFNGVEKQSGGFLWKDQVIV